MFFHMLFSCTLYFRHKFFSPFVTILSDNDRMMKNMRNKNQGLLLSLILEF